MTYEYVCTACGHGWEAEQPISAAPLKACPTCQKETAKRQVSGGAGFILKGSGWYADLYSSPKPGKDKSAEAKEGSKTEAKPDAKTETTKTETKKDGGAAGAAPSTSSSSGDSASSSTSGSTPTKPANTAQT